MSESVAKADTEKTSGSLVNKKHWRWVPTAYIMEGFPDSMIMIVLAIMLKNMGYSNEVITFYTGAIVLPWVLKPIWASFIDVVKTKRWWVYTMEICIAGGFVCMAFSFQSSHFFVLCITISWVIAFMASSNDIATDGYYLKTLKPSEQAFFVGMQGAGYNIGKIVATGGLVVLAGTLFDHFGSYRTAWFIALLIAAVICLCIGLYHKFALPKEARDEDATTIKGALKEFLLVYWDFIRLERLWLAILFLFFYRAGESIINIVLPLFLLSPVDKGGLGLTDQFTGLTYGTLAPIAIILGALLGGYVIYRKGFKYWIWIMLGFENVPHLLYFMIARDHTYSHEVIAMCIFVEQFCFSFGLCAYSIFLFYMVRNSKFKTSHYAFFSGIMSLAVMIPVMCSGWLQKMLGYEYLFLSILLMAIPAGIIIFFIRNQVGNFGCRDKGNEVT